MRLEELILNQTIKKYLHFKNVRLLQLFYFTNGALFK
jgi:hypothetical protein